MSNGMWDYVNSKEIQFITARAKNNLINYKIFTQDNYRCNSNAIFISNVIIRWLLKDKYKVKYYSSKLNRLERFV